jgi:hypothetical protein
MIDVFVSPEMSPQQAADYARNLAGRERHFWVYANDDATWHILLCDQDGGYIFIDKISDQDQATWVAAVLNAALKAA